MRRLEALDVFGNKRLVSENELIWSVHVYGVVVVDGKILLSPQHGIGYDLPGGTMEFGEDYEKAAVREVREETGIIVEPVKLLGIETSLFVWKPDSLNERQAMQSVLIYYECKVKGGKLSKDGFDEEEKEYAELAEWVDISKIDSIRPAASVDFRKYIKQVAGK